MNNINWLELTVEKYHRALKDGNITVKSMVEFYLNRINTYDQNGPCLNAIIKINPNAIKEAEKLDNIFSKTGFMGALHGVPILLKDNVDTKDMPTTGGSLSLKDFIPEKNAHIVESMIHEGAIILAKTNLHEFAIWGETISSMLGQTLNPYDLTRTPGGSSGGTGAGIASNFGMIGIGTDTINSVRSPSSANNLVGIRPTIGRVSKSGVIPYSYTQDAIGPIARTVEDAVKLLDVISGYDPSDSKTAWSVGRINNPLSHHLIKDGLNSKRIGVLNDFFGQDEIHKETNKAVNDALEKMRIEGAVIIGLESQFDSNYLVNQVSVHLYDLKDHLNIYLNKLPAYAPVHSFSEILESGLFHEGIKENLNKANLLSTKTPEYNLRIIERYKVQEQLLKLMADYQLDAIVYPHQKQLVCKVGLSQNERNGVLASVTGFPSICVPAGFSESTIEAPLGVPIGLEILGRPFCESVLVEIAYALEQSAPMRKVPTSVA